MRKYKNKIIAAAVVLVVLALAFFYGGGKQKNDDVSEKNTEISVQTEMSSEKIAESESLKNEEAFFFTEDKSASEEKPTEKAIELKENLTEDKNQKKDTANDAESSINENAENTENGHFCTLSVRCDTALKNAKLTEEKKAVLPEDGVIFAEKTVEFYEGESVFNLLLREMKNNKIHLEFTDTPVYKSVYIEGISNLYELDCGELSGWMYKVNGIFPNYGCSRCELSDGDKVEWVYTCDLGADVGGNNYKESGR